MISSGQNCTQVKSPKVIGFKKEKKKGDQSELGRIPISEGILLDSRKLDFQILHCSGLLFHVFNWIQISGMLKEYEWVIKIFISDVWVHAKSCLTLCDSIHGSPPGSSVHVILQAILEWFAMPSSRGSSPPRDGTHVSYIYLLWQAGYLTPELPRMPFISDTALYGLLYGT